MNHPLKSDETKITKLPAALIQKNGFWVLLSRGFAKFSKTCRIGNEILRARPPGSQRSTERGAFDHDRRRSDDLGGNPNNPEFGGGVVRIEPNQAARGAPTVYLKREESWIMTAIIYSIVRRKWMAIGDATRKTIQAIKGPTLLRENRHDARVQLKRIEPLVVHHLALMLFYCIDAPFSTIDTDENGVQLTRLGEGSQMLAKNAYKRVQSRRGFVEENINMGVIHGEHGP
ncbi:hypothetical protein FPV67DRAFT_1652544 [Lyophyllum atratum]|nr:hypothetical protein FPV67DRAFT_1652544 [Lyophyllum atratum]